MASQLLAFLRRGRRCQERSNSQFLSFALNTDLFMRANDLSDHEFAPYYARYIAKIPDITLRSALDESMAALLEYLTHVPEDRVDYAYAPGKWTIRQCLQHIIDSERIFAYRALRISRGDETPLPGFEQDDYAAAAKVAHRSFMGMVEEFRLVRQTTIHLFKSLSEEDLLRMGTMSGGSVSVRGLGFIICGHVFHHAELYREKYGSAVAS
ncbi:MAG: DinB family protein [Bacteroidota bacterium]